MGLFDGAGFGDGFDLSSIFGIGGAQAGQMPPNFDERFGSPGTFDPNSPPSPTNIPPGMISPTINPTLMGDGGQTRGLGGAGEFANPSPLARGQVPLPRPVPEEAKDLGGGPPTIPGMPPVQTGLARPIMNPAVGAPMNITSSNVGAALTGSEPTPAPAGLPRGTGEAGVVPGGTSGSTDVGGRAKTEEEKRPSLAQALKGVQAPKPPELQKISSPNAPRPTTAIKGGDLQALLMALNAGVPALGGRQLPVTLGRG